MSTVKWLHSGMTGAPSMTGLAGSLVALLDACLVTGFGLGTLDSVVVAGGVATATRAAGHPFEVGTIVNVSGATPAGLNGDKRVLSSTVVAYTFDATGIADQVATGTIVHKAAPLGWEKPFASTNLGVYRSPNVESTRNYLRVNDTINPSYYAQVIGYEEMTAHSAGTKPFPTSAMAASGGCWVKSVTSDSAPRPWVIVGDDRGFYFCSAWGSAGHTTHYFGDINSLKSPDPYRCLLVASPTSWHSSVAGTISQLDVASAYTGGAVWGAIARSVSGYGSSVWTTRPVLFDLGGLSDGAFSGGSGTNRPIFPNPADNGMYLSEIGVGEASSFRGRYPGAFYCPQNIGTLIFPQGSTVTDVMQYPGRIFRAVLNNSGPLFFDVTGPWR